MSVITKELWVDWKNHPVTQFYLKALHFKREQLKEGIAEGQAGSDREICMAIGQTQAYKDALEYAVRQFEYIELEEQDGPESSGISSDPES